MEEAAFRDAFKQNFEDEEEMAEAVYCLNLQGTLYMCISQSDVQSHHLHCVNT